MESSALIIVVVTIAIGIYWRLRNRQQRQPRRRYSLPPGPWGFPIVGHLPWLGSNAPMKFMEWKEIYGPIISVRFGSIKTVVISDSKLMKEAFGKEDLAGRADLKLWVEVNNKTGIIFSEGSINVEQRRFTLHNLKNLGMGRRMMETQIQDEISTFLEALDSQTGRAHKMNDFFRIPVINSFWTLVMGQRFQPNDPRISHMLELLERVTVNTTLLSKISFYFPWIATYLGFLGYNKTLASFREVYKFIEKQLDALREAEADPEAPESFRDIYLETSNNTTDLKSSFHPSKNMQPITTTDIFMGAIDTTTKTLDWLFIRLALNPQIQRDLQKEIVTIIGNARPSMSNKSKMPYTEAVINEILRTAPAAPLGVFHKAMKDVTLGGYLIPKDTMIISNIYGIHHDDHDWENPEAFWPGRFINKDGKFRRLGDICAFSFGKRSCIGESLARDQLFLIITSFFQKFSVSCTETRPSLKLNFDIILAPPPFELFITRREEV